MFFFWPNGGKFSNRNVQTAVGRSATHPSMGDAAYSYRAKGELPLFPKKIDPGRTRTYNLRRSLSSWNPMRYQLHSLSKTRVCATFSAPNLTFDAEPYKNVK